MRPSAARHARHASSRRARRPPRPATARGAGAALAALAAVLVAVGPGLAVGVDPDPRAAVGATESGDPAAAPMSTVPAGAARNVVPVPPVPPVASPRAGAEAAGRAAAPARRASGLPWSSGVFSHDAARTVEFAARRGRPVDVLAVFPTRDTWESVLEPWWMSPSAVPEGFAGTLNVGVPLFPASGSLAAAARGEDVERWRELGALIAARYPDAYVRPGWEMNIPNWAWSANPGNVEDYKRAFRHAATGLRAGGPNLRIVFNPNEGTGGSLPDATLAYPGDEYVDDIGLDAYDWDPGYTAAGWEQHRTQPGGWDFWVGFAREHGKTFSVPEWGVIPGSDTSGGDNPDYITAVLTWMGANADVMSFDTYFEETADYCRCALSLNPRAARAYTDMIARLAGGAAVPAAGVPTRPALPDRAPGEATAAPRIHVLVLPGPARRASASGAGR